MRRIASVVLSVILMMLSGVALAHAQDPAPSTDTTTQTVVVDTSITAGTDDGGDQAQKPPASPPVAAPAPSTPASRAPANSLGDGRFGFAMSGPHGLVSYNQQDPRWGGATYKPGGNTIAAAGCGPTAVAMVVATLTKYEVTPLSVANRFGPRYHPAGSGTDEAMMVPAGRHYGLRTTAVGRDFSKVAHAIMNGGLAIALVHIGHFTGGGHYIVIRAVSADGHKFWFADPNRKGRNGDSETRGFGRHYLHNAKEGNVDAIWTFVPR